MPKKNIRFGALCIIFSFILTSLFLFISPKLNIKAEDASVLVDFKLEATTINTDDGSDTLTVYARGSTTEAEGNVSIEVHLGADVICTEGEGCTATQSQQKYLELMTEGCGVLTDFDITGLEGGCGDYTDGIFSGTFTFPRYSAIGNWMVYTILLSDGVGDGILEVPISTQTKMATTAGGQKNVGFSNEGETEDTTAPTIDDYVIDPATIDTTSSSEVVTMYMRISDDLSEVRLEDQDLNPVSPQIVFSPDDDPGYPNPEQLSLSFSLMTEGCDSLPGGLDVLGLEGTCGNATDGIYMASDSVLQYATGGTWRVTGVYNLTDTLMNANETCTATFENTSESFDLMAPELEGVTITPTEFDTTDSAQNITIAIEVTDDKSGVASVSIGLIPVVEGMAGGYWIGEEFALTSGDANDGTYTAVVELPQGAPLGFWRVNNIDVEDALGRGQRYTTSELSLAFPDLALYLVNQGTTEEITLLGDWLLEDWPYFDGETVVWPAISVKFDEGTTITKEEGGIFAFQRMLATKYDLGESSLDSLLTTVNSDYTEDLTGCEVGEGCTGTTLNDESLVGTPLHILKFGIPGLNLTFSQPVTITIGVDPQYLGETFILQTFDEEEEEWVNQGSCTIVTITPPSREHGGDVYGVFKPVPYAGCQFTTDHASFFSANVLGEEDRGGVPKTGLGGSSYSLLERYFAWR